MISSLVRPVISSGKSFEVFGLEFMMRLIQNLLHLRRIRNITTVPDETFPYEMEIQSNIMPFSMETETCLIFQSLDTS